MTTGGKADNVNQPVDSGSRGDSVWRSLTQEIGAHVNLQKFFRKYIKGFKLGPSVWCPLCKPEDSKPFQVYDDGSWRCFECDNKGPTIVDFHMIYADLADRWTAALAVYAQWVHRIVSDAQIDAWHRDLMDDREERSGLVDRLALRTGISKKAAMRLRLGYHSPTGCVTIPIQNDLNLYVAVALLNPFESQERPLESMLEKNQPRSILWPLEVLQNTDRVVICDSYWDAAVALSFDVPALGIWASEQAVSRACLRLLKGKEIWLAFSKTDAGARGARSIANSLLLNGITDTVRVLDLPVPRFRSWFLSPANKTTEELASLADATGFYHSPALVYQQARNLEDAKKGAEDLEVVPLEETVGDRYFEKMYRTEATVIGRDQNTCKFPKLLEIRCIGPTKKCEGCPLYEEEGNTHFEPLEKDDPRLARLAEASDYELKRFARELLRLKIKCPVQVFERETYTASKLLVSRPIKSYRADHDITPIQITAYYFSTSISINGTYMFTGYTSKFAKDSRTMVVYTEGEPVSTGIEQFMATEEIKETLRQFKPPAINLFDHLMDFYRHLGASVTHIVGRKMTHMAMDLVWHSPLSFYFAGKFIRKAALDVIVYGDTGCGKTRIARSLCDHYEHGEIIGGENISFMGLVGGIKMQPNYYGICWGRIAQAHKGTVVIDEASNLTTSDIDRMSGLRTDGIATIDKQGMSGQANAITGMLWLSNTRTGKYLSKYNYGVDALRELVKKEEDVRRFDYAHAVSIRDVNVSDIARNGDHYEDPKFSTVDCHNLILWIKSRRPDQIKFTPAAVQAVYGAAMEFAGKYHAEVALVVPTVIQDKIAKISAAIAGRVWSTDESGEVLEVTEEHVSACVTFLDRLYESDVLGYLAFSIEEKRYDTVDEHKLSYLFNDASQSTGVSRRELLSAFLQHPTVTRWDIQDWLVGDEHVSKKLLSGLIHSRAMRRDKRGEYEKSEPFIEYLRRRVVLSERPSVDLVDDGKKGFDL